MVRGQPLLQNLAVADDDAEQVVEVVRDAAGELAHGFHFLRLPELLFQPFAVSDVTVHDNQLLYLPGRAGDGAGGGLEYAPRTVLVAHAVFDPPPALAAERFPRSLLDLRAVFGMNLLERRGVPQLFFGVAESLAIGRTVVDAVARGIDQGNHVGRIFADEARQFLALRQLAANAVDLHLLPNRVQVKQQNQADQRANGGVQRGRVNLGGAERQRGNGEGENAHGEQQRDQNGGGPEPPLAALDIRDGGVDRTIVGTTEARLRFGSVHGAPERNTNSVLLPLIRRAPSHRQISPGRRRLAMRRF